MTPERMQYWADYFALLASKRNLCDWGIVVLKQPPDNPQAAADVRCVEGKKIMEVRLSLRWEAYDPELQREYADHELTHAHFDLASEYIFKLLHNIMEPEQAEWHNRIFQWLLEYGIDGSVTTDATNLPLPSNPEPAKETYAPTCDCDCKQSDTNVAPADEPDPFLASKCPRCAHKFGAGDKIWVEQAYGPDPICDACHNELTQPKPEAGQTFRFDYGDPTPNNKPDPDKCLGCNRSLLPSEKMTVPGWPAPACIDCYEASVVGGFFDKYPIPTDTAVSPSVLEAYLASATNNYTVTAPAPEPQKPHERGATSENCPYCLAEVTASPDFAWDSDLGRMRHNCQQQLEAEGAPTEPHVETEQMEGSGVCVA